MQIYEKYWEITLEYSDFNSELFNKCLQIIVDFIDNNDTSAYSKGLYSELQKQVYNFNPKNDFASVRKSINQFLKLGFINNGLTSYHPKTKDFLKATHKETKRCIYSEIMYDNASFSRSVTNPSDKKEINFLIKTLENCKTLTQDNLMAIMTCDVSKSQFISKMDLDKLTQEILCKKFDKRKYNQRNYLWNICKEVLVGIYIDSNGSLTLEKPSFDEQQRIGGARDPYKQTLYKYDLYNESMLVSGKICCFVENLKYPSLIASHIKPFIECSENEQFDVNNGLLLSKNMDYLFDKGWISFKDDGSIECCSNLEQPLRDYLLQKRLDKKYLNEKRLEYLKYHRENVFNNDLTYKI
ncbi:HNH endonuclease [Helicobacter sp. 23-1044]